MKNVCERCDLPAVVGLNDRWFCLAHYQEGVDALLSPGDLLQALIAPCASAEDAYGAGLKLGQRLRKLEEGADW